MSEFSLKPDMLLGAATAATQIEGGNLDSSWHAWAAGGNTLDGSGPQRANDHYNRWQQDADLMREMGLQIYRLGIEWARVQPEFGKFDAAVISHYVEEVRYLREIGIVPLVTLHHFTNPGWFERMGGFANYANVPYFLAFAERMVTEFGALVNEYITINEPNVYATNGYFFGIWPPGDKSFGKAVDVMSNLAAAHIELYQRIHALRAEMGLNDTKASFANHVRAFAPKNPKNLKHRAFAKLTERFFQGSISRAMMRGEFQWPLKNRGGYKKGKYSDFIAVNYYTRSTVTGLGDGTRDNAPVNDLGWEIYPAGLVECAQKLYDLCALPIYVTENGTCDNDDRFRCRYLYDHLQAVCASDLPFERYYHWCFCDNFEWAEGETARFGIVHVNYETQQRTVKRSGNFYTAMIEKHGVDQALFDEFVKNQKYDSKGVESE